MMTNPKYPIFFEVGFFLNQQEWDLLCAEARLHTSSPSPFDRDNIEHFLKKVCLTTIMRIFERFHHHKLSWDGPYKGRLLKDVPLRYLDMCNDVSYVNRSLMSKDDKDAIALYVELKKDEIRWQEENGIY